MRSPRTRHQNQFSQFRETFTKELGWLYFDNEPRVQDNQHVQYQQFLQLIQHIQIAIRNNFHVKKFRAQCTPSPFFLNDFQQTYPFAIKFTPSGIKTYLFLQYGDVKVSLLSTFHCKTVSLTETVATFFTSSC